MSSGSRQSRTEGFEAIDALSLGPGVGIGVWRPGEKWNADIGVHVFEQGLEASIDAEAGHVVADQWNRHAVKSQRKDPLDELGRSFRRDQVTAKSKRLE